jgi:hypothetical protein
MLLWPFFESLMRTFLQKKDLGKNKIENAIQDFKVFLAPAASNVVPIPHSQQTLPPSLLNPYQPPYPHLFVGIQLELSTRNNMIPPIIVQHPLQPLNPFCLVVRQDIYRVQVPHLSWFGSVNVGLR